MKDSEIKLSNGNEIIKICNKYPDINTKSFLNLMGKRNSIIKDQHFLSQKNVLFS